MSIPNYQEFMNPVLKAFSQIGTEAKIKETEDTVAKLLKIPESEHNTLIKSGKSTVIFNRCFWATLYMTNAGLLERTKRGFYKITSEGLKVLDSGVKINDAFLMKYSSFADFINRVGKSVKKDIKQTPKQPESIFDAEEDPETRMEKAIKEMEAVLQEEILISLKNLHPERFEQVVVDLMEAMDYGVGKTTRYVGDGGIDGIIDEDELGLSKIYLQAKRYSDGKVQEKEMRDFMGALTSQPVSKGVFITTSNFSEKAINMANNSKHHIVRLINGYELVNLMMKHNLGVRLKKGYEVKEIDNSFFEE